MGEQAVGIAVAVAGRVGFEHVSASMEGTEQILNKVNK